jgi:hypothetical protein
MAIILKAIKVNLFVSSVLFVFSYHSPNFLDTSRTVPFVDATVVHDGQTDMVQLEVALRSFLNKPIN